MVEVNVGVEQLEYLEMFKKMVVLTNKNNLLLKDPEDLSKRPKEKLLKTDLRHFYKIKEENLIMRFRVLDCQNRMLLFLRSPKAPPELIFNSVAIVDLDLEMCGKCILQATGTNQFGAVAVNRDGSEAFTVKQKGETWDLLFYENKIRVNMHNQKNLQQKKCKLEFPEKGEISLAPVALCYAYLFEKKKKKKPRLIVSCDSGKLLLFGITKTRNDESNLSIKLKLLKSHEFIKNQGEGILREHFTQFVLSWDHKFVLGLTRLSEIYIIKLRTKKLVVKTHIPTTGTLSQISLSLNGQFLATCGAFATSVAMYDLAEVNEKSFGKGGPDCLSRIRDEATDVAREQGDKMANLFDKYIYYRHENMALFVRKMQYRIEEIIAENSKNQNEKDKKINEQRRREINSEREKDNLSDDSEGQSEGSGLGGDSQDSESQHYSSSED